MLEEIVRLIRGGKVGTNTVSCPSTPAQIQGIVTGNALDAGDVFGNIFELEVPKSGVIQSATFYDFDDEGEQVDLEVFIGRITQIASDASWAPSDIDMLKFRTEIQFFTFDDHINSQTSEVKNIGKAYSAPQGKLFIQAVCRGTPNIAAGSLPRFQLQILSDDPNWKER